MAPEEARRDTALLPVSRLARPFVEDLHDPEQRSGAAEPERDALSIGCHRADPHDPPQDEMRVIRGVPGLPHEFVAQEISQPGAIEELTQVLARESRQRRDPA